MSVRTPADSEQHKAEKYINPLLEHISLASTEVELLRLLPKNPFLDKKWLLQHQDIDLIRSYLSEVVVPTRALLQIGLDIHRAFKTAAYQLDPLLKQNRTDYFSPFQSTTAFATTQTTHCGVVVSGLTGLGKTFTLVAVLRTIPQVIKLKGIPGMAEVIQITWIRIDMSSVASIEALAEQIIRAIDEALDAGGKEYDAILAGVRSASAKMERALRLMRTYYVTILAVDEIQAGNFARPNSSELRFWFLRIANQKIALIFSGNPLGFELHPPKKDSDEAKYSTQQLRRLFATNRTRLDPASSINDPDWNKLVRTLARCHLDGSCDPIDDELEEFKLQLTGGFPDFYVALHCELEKLRLANPQRKVDKPLISQAAKASSLIQVMQPLITAFATQDLIALRRCIDVDHDYYQQLWLPLASSENSITTAAAAIHPSSPSSIPDIDLEKTAEMDRKKIESKGDRKRAAASTPASSLKGEIVGYHLDQLDSLIAGTPAADAAK